MPTLGEVLTDARHRRGVTPDQVEADLRIRKKYLVALEEDDFASLPAPVYTRGFVRLYAEYLGVDPVFAEKLFQPPERSTAIPIRPAATGLREPSAITLRGLLTALLALIGLGAVIYLYAQYLNFTSTTPADLAPRAVAQPTPTSAAVVAPLPTALPTATPAPSPTPVRGVEVVLVVSERTWLRVIADGQPVPVFEGELQAGTTRTWQAKEKIDMRLGNAGGVEATVNGMKQGKLGASGEVKNVTWGSSR